MNQIDQDERELAELMRRATRDLDVPAGRLAAGGLRRGRVARLRRRTGVGLTAVAVAVGVGVGGSVALGYQVLPNGNGTSSAAKQSPGSPLLAVPAAGSSAPATARRKLADRQSVLHRVLDALPSRTVTDPTIETLGQGQAGYRISLHLGGALVTFLVDDPNSMRTAAGLPSLGPGSECQGSQPMPATCHENADGSWENNFTRPTGGVGVPADFVENDAWFWTADGWRIYSAAYNATEEKTGTRTGDRPPLTVAQLAAIAQSDVWFRGAR